VKRLSGPETPLAIAAVPPRCSGALLVTTRSTRQASPAGLAALPGRLAAELRADGNAAALALPPRLDLEVWLERLLDERTFYRKAPASVARRLPPARD